MHPSPPTTFSSDSICFSYSLNLYWVLPVCQTLGRTMGIRYSPCLLDPRKILVHPLCLLRPPAMGPRGPFLTWMWVELNLSHFISLHPLFTCCCKFSVQWLLPDRPGKDHSLGFICWVQAFYLIATWTHWLYMETNQPFIYFKIYLFIFGCVGSSFLCEGFLKLRWAGATLHRGARASQYRSLSCCGAQAPDAQAE